MEEVSLSLSIQSILKMKRSIYTLCKSDLTPLQFRLPSIALPTGQQRRQRRQQQQQGQLAQGQTARSQQQPLAGRQSPLKTLRTQRATLLEPVVQPPRQQGRVAGQSISERLRQRVRNSNHHLDESISNTTFIINRNSRDYSMIQRTTSTRLSNSAWINAGTGRVCIPTIHHIGRRSPTQVTPLTSTARSPRPFCGGGGYHANNNNERQLPSGPTNSLAVIEDSGGQRRSAAVANRTLNMRPISVRTNGDRRQKALKDGFMKRNANSLRDGRQRTENGNNQNSQTSPISSSARISFGMLLLLNYFHPLLFIFFCA